MVLLIVQKISRKRTDIRHAVSWCGPDARLHVVANGTMTGQRYIDEVLLPHVRLFRGAVGDKFGFMDDNATCHRTLAVQDYLDSEVAVRYYPPTNKNTLIRALTEEWDKLPQQLLDNFVQTNHGRLVCGHDHTLTRGWCCRVAGLNTPATEDHSWCRRVDESVLAQSSHVDGVWEL
ncbi:hypothetical protein TNCV_1583631 [Trichonephila clavipes]|nr:hypothetical protein TNCV_1583631 [Trichonephila clavipes]